MDAALRKVRIGSLRFALISFLSSFFISCSGLPLSSPRTPPPEYHQKVGLYVDDKVEKFYSFGSASGDASNRMAFHLQQTLPARMQEVLQKMFSSVEVIEPGAKITFKTPDLAGFFFMKILSIRYDYPDPNLTVYRAEVEMLAEFKTFDQELVWSRVVRGEGSGYDDPNFRLNNFSKGSSAAIEDAFLRTVDDMEDEIYKSPTLREYFRRRLPGL